MSDDSAKIVRYTKTRLLDHDHALQKGDFLLHPDGTWTASTGDEDVATTIDGSNRLLTRSLQNWHTHLGMVLNRGMGEGLSLDRWLNENIFVVEKRLTADYVAVGTRAAACELIATGTTFACDMYYHPDIVAGALDEARLRGWLVYTTPSARDATLSRMPSSA